MKLLAGILSGSALLLAGVLLTGCLPSAQSQSDEEKEPHFLAGKNHVNAMDYKGAIESFEKALEVNPQSGLAHFELGWLYDQKEGEPAAAIYHYEQFLKLRPNADNTEMVRTRILACKQQLARTVSLGPVTQTLQREFEQLTLENKRLTEENKRLRDDLEKWRVYQARSVLSPATNPPPAQPQPPVPLTRPAGLAASTHQPNAALVSSESTTPAPTDRGTTSATSAVKTHTVKAGETPSMIARKYGIKVDALLAANPRLDPRRMKVGQAVAIPVSQ